MHQTIEEAEAATDDYLLPCCHKRTRQEVAGENEVVKMDDMTKDKE